MTTTLSKQTYAPGAAAALDLVYDFLSAQTGAHPHYFLSAQGTGDSVEIPVELEQILVQVVSAMRKGLAVSVIPQARSLSTQQAADLLGISRPTLVKLLDSGVIPFERRGRSHRTVRLRDALEYNGRRRAEQYAALAAMSVDIDDSDDPAETLELLRQARKRVAVRRNSR